MAPSKKKTQLSSWLSNDLALWFKNQILTVDVAVAERWVNLLIVAFLLWMVLLQQLHYNIMPYYSHVIKKFKYPGFAVINPFEETHL